MRPDKKGWSARKAYHGPKPVGRSRPRRVPSIATQRRATQPRPTSQSDQWHGASDLGKHPTAWRSQPLGCELGHAHCAFLRRAMGATMRPRMGHQRAMSPGGDDETLAAALPSATLALAKPMRSRSRGARAVSASSAICARQRSVAVGVAGMAVAGPQTFRRFEIWPSTWRLVDGIASGEGRHAPLSTRIRKGGNHDLDSDAADFRPSCDARLC